MKRNYALFALVVVCGLATTAATRADFTNVQTVDPEATSQFIALVNGLDSVSQERKNLVINFLRTASQQAPASLPAIAVATVTETGSTNT